MLGEIGTDAKSGLVNEPAFVGRDREIEQLQACLDSAISGKGKTVFISGEAGTGKTRLLKEFLNVQRRKNVQALTGWCLSNASCAYFPFIEAFENFAAACKKDPLSSMPKKIWHELEAATSVLGNPPQPKPEPSENLPPEVWKDTTFSTLAKALKSLSEFEPTIVVVDDLHWSDSASLNLLHYLSRVLASERVILVGTFRSEELQHDIDGRSHPLVETIRLMKRDDLLTEVKLSNLSKPHAIKLAENLVGGRLHSEFAGKLLTESLGNPLFIVEFIKTLLDNRQIVQEKGIFCLATGELPIPAKIRDIILRRADKLKSNQRRMLDYASVIGEKFDPILLGSTLSEETLNTLEELQQISDATALICCEENTFRFDHAKSKEVIYGEIPSALKRQYHERIAETLEESAKTTKEFPADYLTYHYMQAGNKKKVVDLAYHYSSAENLEKAVKYSLAAGQEALVLFSGSEAIKHFKYVLNATSDLPEYANDRLIALEGLADGYFARAQISDSLAALEQLSNAAVSDEVRLRALRKGIYASVTQGNYSLARELASKAVENPQLDLLESARVHMLKGMLKNFTGEGKEALLYLEDALKVFEEEFSLQDIADVLVEMAMTYVFYGRTEESFVATLRSWALNNYMRNQDRQHYAHCNLDMAFLYCGFIKEAAESDAVTFSISDKQTDPVSRGWEEAFGYVFKTSILEAVAANRMFSGLSLDSMSDFGTGAKLKFMLGSLLSGSFGEFRRGLKEAVVASLKGAECAELTDSYLVRALNYLNLVRLYAELGQMDNADAYYLKMTKLLEETSVGEQAFAFSMWLFSKAVYFSSKKQWEQSNSSYEECLARCKQIEAPLGFQAAVRQSYCWTLLQQNRFDDAKRQFDEAKRVLVDFEKRFQRSTVHASLLTLTRLELGKDFSVRLDMVNVGKTVSSLVKVDGLVSPDFKVIAAQPSYKIKQDGSIDLQMKKVNPFGIEPFVLTLQSTKAGAFTLRPQVVYVDDLGETKTCAPKTVTVTVQPSWPEFEVKPAISTELPAQPVPAGALLEFDFKTKEAKKAFDYLLGSFAEDYMRRRLPLEWSGWRTINEIKKQTRLPARAVYGTASHHGHAISELVHRGIAEARVFSGERGRGGNISKLRICYEKETVRRKVDEKIMKTGKNR